MAAAIAVMMSVPTMALRMPPPGTPVGVGILVKKSRFQAPTPRRMHVTRIQPMTKMPMLADTQAMTRTRVSPSLRPAVERARHAFQAGHARPPTRLRTRRQPGLGDELEDDRHGEEDEPDLHQRTALHARLRPQETQARSSRRSSVPARAMRR